MVSTRHRKWVTIVAVIVEVDDAVIAPVIFDVHVHGNAILIVIWPVDPLLTNLRAAVLRIVAPRFLLEDARTGTPPA